MNNNTEHGIIYTWGYQSKCIQNILDVCRENNIGLVIDVRRNAKSQQPDWNKDVLLRHLDGIDGKPKYIHFPELGNYGYLPIWKRGPEEKVNKALIHIELILMKGFNVLLLCREIEYTICHRQEIAHELYTHTGCKVVHLESQIRNNKKGKQLELF